ncbi:sensor histidine kinase [Actinomadura rayongensis]|uniref:Signal transduction histidine-protein kinase/phosphatase MprB n=1 Tax=Actinomadura rayongensis TaxID=1429076 RepID=A0A6I4W4C3_9ACTN|nr:HAMP domain-containing sensor histidine kinase [Actinomadura rayongensis]MXQ63570.1 HAMP domain-containing protein [Actinomadura rayongensis]
MRRTLVLVSLAVTSMVALAFLIPLALTVREIARDRALADAVREAGALRRPVAAAWSGGTGTADRAALARAVADTRAGAARHAVVHLPGGRTVPADVRGRAGAAPLDAVVRAGVADTVRVRGGYAVLDPVWLPDGRTAVVEVFVPAATASQGVPAAWLVITTVAVALVAGSVAVADRLGRRMIRSTRRLAGAATAFGAGDLGVRVDPDGPPEVVEAALAFNAMADQVVRLLAAEREMAADLSHRLRTPLAALRLNAEALGDGPDAARARASVDRVEREVDEVIRAVRRPTARGNCDAAAVLRDRVAFWSVLAEDEGRPLALTGASGSAPVPLPAAELAAAVDAVLGNVFRHTPEGTACAVALGRGPGGVAITVADGGPGIADPGAALRRGSSGGGSTGLGLDIARRAAAATGGRLTVERSALGGAQVRLALRTGSVAARRPGRWTAFWGRHGHDRPSGGTPQHM